MRGQASAKTQVINMLDKTVQPYIDYIRDLSDREFTGRTKFELNWFKGGIANMNIETEPLPGVIQTESVVLKK